MKVDATLRGYHLRDVPAWARRCEELGFDGLFTTETNHDPFFPLVLAAEHTERVELGTGIALAFPRSPMSLAYMAWDLQALARGRFVLGLGSQIKAHVEKRFSAVWSHPARRMRELVQAVREIWGAWDDGSQLAFRGEFYRHTLMPPAFSPGPNPYGPPRIFLAAVQTGMIEVAGEVADGLMVHPLQSERYVRETVLPGVQRGLARAGRGGEGFEVSLSLFAVTSDEEAEDTRRRIGFYGSTPAYRGVLEAHGWGDLQTELHALSRSGGWDEMPRLVSDEILETFAVVGATPEEVGEKARARYDGLVQRINLHAGERSEPERWAGVIPALAKPA